MGLATQATDGLTGGPDTGDGLLTNREEEVSKFDNNAEGNEMGEYEGDNDWKKYSDH